MWVFELGRRGRKTGLCKCNTLRLLDFWCILGSERTKANMWLNAYFRVAYGPKEVVVSQIIRCEPSSVSKRDHIVKTCPSTK